MKTTIRKINARPSQRILVMSDVHGHIDNLFQLLKKPDYTKDDILVVVGDLIEKGRTVCARCAVSWSFPRGKMSIFPWEMWTCTDTSF